ncbi:MAG: hypothetical protein KIT84_17960 [Labilithrix sp.]|nr:hypothetical protein [Labilithrix sp.]MCW5812918.1 hypothetical protein [Labilithrix sp.]
MKRWVVLAIAIAGCRTIVGIDDLEGPIGGPGPGGGPGLEGGADAPSGGDDCRGRSDCRRCCKESFRFAERFERPDAGGYRCLCRDDRCGGVGKGCTAECATGMRLSGEAGAPSPCIVCVDDELARREGSCEDDGCGDDKDCRDGLRCMQSCQGP